MHNLGNIDISTQNVSKNSIPECFRMRMSLFRLKPIDPNSFYKRLGI